MTRREASNYGACTLVARYSCLQNRSPYAKNPRSEFLFVWLQGQTHEAWNLRGGGARVQRQRRLARAAFRVARTSRFVCLSLEPYKQKLIVCTFCTVTTVLQAIVKAPTLLSRSTRRGNALLRTPPPPRPGACCKCSQASCGGLRASLHTAQTLQP
jgi:hypothetical protein